MKKHSVPVEELDFSFLSPGLAVFSAFVVFVLGAATLLAAAVVTGASAWKVGEGCEEDDVRDVTKQLAKVLAAGALRGRLRRVEERLRWVSPFAVAHFLGPVAAAWCLAGVAAGRLGIALFRNTPEMILPHCASRREELKRGQPEPDLSPWPAEEKR